MTSNTKQPSFATIKISKQAYSCNYTRTYKASRRCVIQLAQFQLVIY